MGVAVVLLAATPFFTARASANDSIARATTEGKDVNHTFIDAAGSAGDIAVSADHIYWAAGDAIGRARRDGRTPQPRFITGLTSVGGLTVSNEHVYWATGDAVGRARLDGTEVQPGFMTSTGGAEDVAARDPYLYWTSDTGIGRASLDGTDPDPTFIDTGVTASFESPNGVYRPVSLAVNSAHIFWTYSTYELGTATSDVARARLDGSGFTHLLTGGGFRGNLYGSLAATDERGFAAVSSGLNNAGLGIFSANANPPGPSCCLATWATEGGVGGVAVADRHVYWTHASEGGLHCTFDHTRREQRQVGRKVRFKVWFEACEELTARASGRVRMRGETYRLETKKASVGPTDRSLALKPKRGGRVEILKTLEAGGTAKALIRLRMKDNSGDSIVRKYRARLRSATR